MIDPTTALMLAAEALADVDPPEAARLWRAYTEAEERELLAVGLVTAKPAPAHPRRPRTRRP